MILYHGSYVEVVKPDLVHSRSNVDFGCGFYVTPLREQAVKWCGKFKRRGREGIISSYVYDVCRENELKILKFDSYSEEWLDFILKKELNKVEKKIDKLEQEIKDLSKELLKEEVYLDREKALSIQKKIDELNCSLDENNKEWEELMEKTIIN